jgi:hypothetical protein
MVGRIRLGQNSEQDEDCGAMAWDGCSRACEMHLGNAVDEYSRGWSKGPRSFWTVLFCELVLNTRIKVDKHFIDATTLQNRDF